MSHPTHNYTSLFTRRQTLITMLGSVALHGCGGGGSVAGLSSGGTGSFTNGVIIGLGSIIVNGIRYDDTKATVNGGTGASNDLKLGMVVSVQGSSVTPPTVTGGLATATASSISYGSEWKGPVDSVDTANNSFVVFGQTVKVLGTTVFDGGTLSSLAGNFVEVHGFLDPGSNALSASRVEVKNSLSAFRLSGAIRNLSTANRTFEMGGAPISFATAAERPATLADDMVVRVDLETAQNISGQWIATRVISVNALSDIDAEDDDKAEIEGSITSYTSSSVFSVNGIPVNASNANRPAGLSLGSRVKVEGSVANGTIVASKVELEDDNSVEAREFEFHGTISGLNADLKTFVVKGYTLNYVSSGPSATQFEPERAVLSNGLQVEVKARQDASGQLIAIEIKVDD